MEVLIHLKAHYLYALALLLIPNHVAGTWYTVGNLNNWGIPPSGNPLVYMEWADSRKFQIGDSISFLYPPGVDSVIQVTAENFKSCNISNPLFSMDDGNSVFDLTSSGEYFFTSATPGRCEQLQKLHIVVGITTAYPKNYGFEKLPTPSTSPPPYSNSNSTPALSPSASASSNSTAPVSPPRSIALSSAINTSWLLAMSISSAIILTLCY